MAPSAATRGHRRSRQWDEDDQSQPRPPRPRLQRRAARDSSRRLRRSSATRCSAATTAERADRSARRGRTQARHRHVCDLLAASRVGGDHRIGDGCRSCRRSVSIRSAMCVLALPAWLLSAVAYTSVIHSAGQRKPPCLSRPFAPIAGAGRLRSMATEVRHGAGGSRPNHCSGAGADRSGRGQRGRARAQPQHGRDHPGQRHNPVQHAARALLVVILVAVREPRDALFGIVLVTNALIGIIQELRAKATLDRLAVLTAPRVSVVRDGSPTEVDVAQVVDRRPCAAQGWRPAPCRRSDRRRNGTRDRRVASDG